ncbi:MAG: hypothetical protein QP733_06705, partial [Dialister micraerophilus]|nr:hypothetical protein [Dialister micraerophilus]
MKDGGTGKADVTLGGDTKQEVTFKAAVDKTTEATANGSSLTSSVDKDRNVTYTLNMKQLKQDLGITGGTGGVMSSWKLKVKDETTPQEIKNGEAVTFDVAAADKGLTVTRDGKTIKYGIEGSKIDIANNQSITNLGKRIDNLDPIHYFSVNSTDKGAGSNYKNDGAKKDGSIAIGPSALNNGTQSVAVGFKSKVEDGWFSVALGTESKTNGHFTTAIGYRASATKSQSLALGTQAEAAAESGISIGVNAKSLANRGIAVGTNSTVGATGGRGIAIGDGSYVGAKTNDHPGKGMPNPGDEWKPGKPYATADDDTVAGPGKLSEENSMAIGMKASAFGFQTTALGAGAEAHDTNTTAVGVAAVAKGHYSTALGKQARTFEKESTSVGHWADSRAEFATSVGANTIVYKKGGVALGSGARAYDENSVAIGSNSIAKEAVDGKAYLSGEDVKAAAGIMSVGNPKYKVGDKDVAANYRRIVNVAGGINDNDAVNVAQLKAGRTTVEAGDYVTVTSGQKSGVDGTVYTVKGPKLTSKDTNLTVTDEEETVAGTTDKKKVGYKLELSKTLTGLESVSSKVFNAGNNVTLGETGLTITGGPSVTTTGIDAGSKTITNVTAGVADGDAVNFKQLKDVDSKVTTNTGNIATNKNAIATNKAAIEKNAEAIGKNTENIGKNTEAIGKNTEAIGKNTEAIGKNTENIGKNTEAIGKNTEAIGKNTEAIGKNTEKIGKNTEAIGKNTENIGKNTTAISENKTAIGKNTKAIEQHTKDIAKNAGDIATNKMDIAKNAGAIKDLTTRVDANADNIAANTTKIDKNTENIGKNTTAIENNTKAIAGKMTSWKLKAEGVAGEEEIKDGNEVTFGVKEADKGLTVTREGSTIKYGIDGSKIDIKE